MKRTLSELDPSYFEQDKMGTFELFGVHVTEIPVKAELLPTITKAKLSRCRLQELPVGLNKYSHLKLLDLSENEFTEINPITFAPLTSLQYLDVSINNIHTLPNKLPLSIIHLDLSFNRELDLSSVFSLKLPSLEVLKLTHCNISKFPETEPAWKDTIKSLALDGNELTEIPKFTRVCPQLDELILLGNNIKEVALEEEMSMKMINLSMNPLTTIKDYKKAQIQVVHLNNTHLTTFPLSHDLSDSIRVMALANSGIKGTIDVTLPPQLAFLDMSYNEIEGLSPTFISSLGSAAVINLSFNKLETIPDCFPESLSFSQILLSNNNIHELPPSLMKSRPLERFVVSHNQLEHIPDFKFPQLREFDVSFNKLKDLPDSFTTCSFLVTVNVSYNKLTDFPLSLSNSRRMLDLLAAHNEFTILPPAIFGLASLRLLVLSMNHLTRLNSSLSAFFFLKTLDLANNNFIEVPKEILSLRALKTLSLSHNLIEKVDAKANLPISLTSLDLSFNLIEEFDPTPLTNLTALCISCNKLKTRNISNNGGIVFYSDFANNIQEDLTDYSNLSNLKNIEYFGNGCDEFESEEEDCSPHSMVPVLNTNWETGYASMIGPRPTMEDVVSIVSKTNNDMMIALFDGHAGFGAASNAGVFMEEEYNQIVNKEKESVPQQIVEAFRNVEKNLYEKDVDGGCTCATAFILNRTVFTAAIGDSRIVRVKKSSYERITTDHKPWLPDEFQRLKEANLGVTIDRRIWRKLAVARALGDFWCSGYQGLFVDPEVNSFEIEDDDVGIVVACDGLWDVLYDKDVADIVRDAKTAEDAAITLKNCCLALASTDNTSVVVVRFKEGGFDTRNTVERIPIVPEQEQEVVLPSNRYAARRSSRMRR